MNFWDVCGIALLCLIVLGIVRARRRTTPAPLEAVRGPQAAAQQPTQAGTPAAAGQAQPAAQVRQREPARVAERAAWLRGSVYRLVVSAIIIAAVVWLFPKFWRVLPTLTGEDREVVEKPLALAGAPSRPPLALTKPGLVLPPEQKESPPDVPRREPLPAQVAQERKPAQEEPRRQLPRELPSIPMRVTELDPGRVWHFEIRGPTDIRAVAAHVRKASSATVRLRGGKTYRFKAPGVPRGRVHVTTQYLPSSQSMVKDALMPGEELPHGITKIFPQHDMVTTVWQEGSMGPIEVVIEETGESQEAAEARLARMVDSQPVVP